MNVNKETTMTPSFQGVMGNEEKNHQRSKDLEALALAKQIEASRQYVTLRENRNTVRLVERRKYLTKY